MSKEKNDSTNSKTKTTKTKEQKKETKKPNLLHKIFGELKMSWIRIIIFAIIMGIYTALMALLVPDGNSFHDISVTAYNYTYYFDKNKDTLILMPE